MKISDYLHSNPKTSIVASGLLLHFVAQFFAQSVDADSTSRLFISDALAHNWHVISSGIWGPIHFYLNAILLAILPYSVAIGALKWLHISLGIWAATGMYQLSYQLFKSKEGALIAGFSLLLSPIIFRNSHHLLAGVPFIAFVVQSLYLCVKGIDNDRFKSFFVAGLLMTLAAGMRYEAWLLMALISIVIWLNRSFIKGVAFASTALIFPVFWMIGNYMAHGDFFYGVSSATVWNQELEGNNEYIDNAIRLERILFFPWSLWLGITPILLVLLLHSISKSYKNFNRLQASFLGIFAIVLSIYCYKAYNGTLFLQHRFTSLPIALLLPFWGTLVFQPYYAKKRLVSIALMLAIPLSFVVYKIPIDKLFGFSYTLNTAFEKLIVETGETSEAIPRHKYPALEKVKALIVSENTPLVIDYFNWQTHAYLGEHSPQGFHKTFMNKGAKNEQLDSEALKQFVTENPSGILITGIERKLFESFVFKGTTALLPTDTDTDTLQLNLTLSLKSGVYTCYNYTLKVDTVVDLDQTQPTLFLPIRDRDFYSFQIKNDGNWLAAVRKNAFKNFAFLSNQIENEAQWMVDNSTDK